MTSVGALISGALWLVAVFFFMLEAWGLRGMAKPWWMPLAAGVCCLGWLLPTALIVMTVVFLGRSQPQKQR